MSGNSLADGAAQLRNAAEHLWHAWEASQDGWDDVVRQRIEAERIEPLRKQLELAFAATQQLADVLNAARRHCRDADRPS
uniref:Uncharacterized protein n=1 Tax=Schlesneria paludicola TaxID=360056 RepID=A0A7C4LLZ4_9PLAN